MPPPLFRSASRIAQCLNGEEHVHVRGGRGDSCPLSGTVMAILGTKQSKLNIYNGLKLAFDPLTHFFQVT